MTHSVFLSFHQERKSCATPFCRASKICGKEVSLNWGTYLLLKQVPKMIEFEFNMQRSRMNATRYFGPTFLQFQPPILLNGNFLCSENQIKKKYIEFNLLILHSNNSVLLWKSQYLSHNNINKSTFISRKSFQRSFILFHSMFSPVIPL